MDTLTEKMAATRPKEETMNVAARGREREHAMSIQILAFCTTVLVGAVFAAPVAANPTHLGQSASRMVVLRLNQGDPCIESDRSSDLRGFFLTLPDGSFGGPLIIPPKQVLVVTDINWERLSGRPSEVARLVLLRVSTADPRQLNVAHASVLQPSFMGAGWKSEVLTSGFSVSSAATLCADIRNFTGGTIGSGLPLSNNLLLLRGYFADDE
jgi:hypothetical protein